MKVSSLISIFKHMWKLNADEIAKIYKRFTSRTPLVIPNCSTLPPVTDVLDQAYVFVLSTGRCGTLLMTKILSRSSDLCVQHNPKPELEYASAVLHRDNLGVEAQMLAMLAARFDIFFLDCYLRGKTYVETNNRISLFAPGLSRLLPKAKFIHLVRNPADFVRSGMRRNYYKQGFIQHQRLDGSQNLCWQSFSQLEKIAWEWNEINLKIEDFKASTNTDRILTIKSEDLYEKKQTISQLFDFLGVSNPFYGVKQEQSLREILANPVNAQKAGKFPRYRDWSERDKHALWRIATLAPKYGYGSANSA